MSEQIDMTAGLIKHSQPTFHFLLTSVFTWRTGTDLHDLMKAMDKEGYTYWVWLVPVEQSEPYEINFFQPQVPGSFLLAEVEKKPKAKR